MIRAGSYSGAAIRKSLTVIGQGRPTLTDLSFSTDPTLSVLGLAAGDAVHLADLRITTGPIGVPVAVAAGAALVHFDGVEIDTGTQFTIDRAACTIDNSSSVTFTGSRLVGYPAAQVRQSTVAFASTQILGGNNCGSIRCVPVGVGLVAWTSAIQLADVELRGGSGGAPWNPFSQPREAILASDSRLLLTGATTADAGTNGSAAKPGIEANGGRIDLDPSVRVTGYNGAPPIRGTAPIHRRPIVSLTATSAAPGGTVQARTSVPVGDPFGLYLGIAHPATKLPIGVLWVDPVQHVLVRAGTGPASGPVRITIPIPPNASLTGQSFAMQTSCFYRSTNAVELSNPVVLLVD